MEADDPEPAAEPGQPGGPARIANLLEHLNEEFRGVPAARAAMQEWLVRALLLLLARERAGLPRRLNQADGSSTSSTGSGPSSNGASRSTGACRAMPPP